MNDKQRQQIIDKNDVQPKNFWDIYKVHCVFMKLGLIWPSAKGDGLRRALIGVVTILSVPCLVVIGNDIRLRVLSSDVPNLIRQLIVIIAVVNVKVKMFLSIIQAKQLKEVIDAINDDYIHFHTLPEEYQGLIKRTIRQTKISLYIWTVAIGGTTLSFPTLAAAFTVYSQLFSEAPRKYMVHECRLIFVDDEHQYSAPYYHTFAGYSTYIILLVFVGFVAYDGLFIITILHVSLRLRIISHNLLHLIHGDPGVQEINKRIKEFVRDHCGCLRFTAKVERCFQWWLIMLFFNAVLQIVMSLSQTTKKNLSRNMINMAYSLIIYFIIYITCWTIRLEAKGVEQGLKISPHALAQYEVTVTYLQILFFSSDMHGLRFSYDVFLQRKIFGVFAQESDYKLMYYLLFTAVSIHTHLLCHLTSQVTQCAEDIANVAYNTSWEVIPDSGVRKSLALIMTRAQVPTYFKAMGMLTFNMQLFVKILQTSYSMFTILRK